MGNHRGLLQNPVARKCGCNSVGRVPASQAGSRGFKSHYPLYERKHTGFATVGVNGSCANFALIRVIRDLEDDVGRDSMENFWGIVSRWGPFGQFIFFLIVLGGFATLIKQLAYYFAVVLRGWPPEHIIHDEEE